MRPGYYCREDCTVDCGHCKGKPKRRVVIEVTCEPEDALSGVLTKVSDAVRKIDGIHVMHVSNQPWGK